MGTDPRELTASQLKCDQDPDCAGAIDDGNLAAWNRGCRANNSPDWCYVPLSRAARTAGCLAGIERHCTP